MKFFIVKQNVTNLLILLFSSLPLVLSARGMEDFMRSTGKIYVVVAVIVLGFIGLFCFMMYMDRKLSKLESLLKDKAE